MFGSAIVSGSEVAFFSISHEKIVQLRQSDNRIDHRILRLLNAPQRLLATILILNNFINVAIVVYSTYLVWFYFGKDQSSVLAGLTFFITFMIVFFGELTPKVYANQNNISFARFTSGLLNVSSYMLRPLSWLLTSTTGLIENKIKKTGYNVSVDDLHQALEMTVGVNTTNEEKEILKGIINFGMITTKQIMKSRMDIYAVDKSLTYHELLDKVNKSGFSRIPVYNETVDHIEGILYVKDLIPFIEEDEHFEWQALLRDGFYIPETKKIDDLLRDFQEKRVHLAIVVDEYGGTAGLATLEDVIEEIVGEFNDEFDE
jgi:gliding motility-associated protein GldE